MTAWDNMVGHAWAVEQLQSAIRHGRIGHAYLLTGPEQVGKRTLARLFAQALNCPEPGAPCGICRSCRLIAADRHPDVLMVPPELSGRGKLTHKIETIRTLQRDLQLGTREGRWKVALLPRFDAATPGAANAFLKTLEEPPPSVILLLTALDADALLETIKSRCRVVPLRPVPVAQVRDALINRFGAPRDEADRLARLSGGRPGWALQAREKPELLTDHAAALTLLYEMLAGNRVARFAQAEKLADKPEGLPALLAVWSAWWRDVVLVQQGSGALEGVVNREALPRLQKVAGGFSADAVLKAIRQTESTSQWLGQNVNARLALEVLFLHYPLAPGINAG
jgi:DNA polymerase-3 subunit delta'